MRKKNLARLDAQSLLFGSAPCTSCVRRCAQPVTSSVAGGCDELLCRSATWEGNEARVWQCCESQQASPSSAGLHLQKEANNVAGHIFCTEHQRCSKPWRTAYIPHSRKEVKTLLVGTSRQEPQEWLFFFPDCPVKEHREQFLLPQLMVSPPRVPLPDWGHYCLYRDAVRTTTVL